MYGITKIYLFIFIDCRSLNEINTDAVAQVGTDPEAGVAHAFEGALHVDALAILAHPTGRALVHVHAERIVP